MPSALASGTKTIFWWKGNITPPKDAAKWSALIRELVAHLRERYGAAEIQQWYFEVWNEPDLHDLFFSGSLEDYLALYKKHRGGESRPSVPACRVWRSSLGDAICVLRRRFEKYVVRR